MRILGIDPGLKATGYGLIDHTQRETKLLEVGVIQPNPHAPLRDRIHKIYTVLNELISQYEPNIFILEKLYSHHEHPTTANVLGHLRGVICLLSAQRNIELVEHSVKRIRKALVGNGNATKQQTKRMVAHLLKIEEDKLNFDASDALALVLGYIHIHKTNRVLQRS